MKQFSIAFRIEPIIKASPRALVILLYGPADLGLSLECVADQWAASVPTTAFVGVRGGTEAQSLTLCASNALSNRTSELPLLETALALEPVLVNQLRSLRLNVGRVVLVGFGSTGMLALHFALVQRWTCAGVLAFGANLTRPLCRFGSSAQKVRLIGFAEHASHSRLRDDVASLTARGIDARGILLAGSGLSQEAIRHGGAYLVELVATAQREDRTSVERTVPRILSGDWT